MMDFTGLATLQDDGSAPSSRMESAWETKQRIDLLINADDAERAYKRSLVKGLVEGNPPFREQDTIAAGRADMCNVNWRIAEAYLAMALAIRYQMFSDTPTWAVVATDFGKGQEATDWGAIMTEEFDRLQQSDRYFDYNVQCSQLDTVLYGIGPMMFRDKFDWRCKYSPAGQLYVPEMSPSCTEEWEEAALRVYYTPHDLYSMIRHEEAAAAAGFNIAEVKRSIIAAFPRSREAQYKNWEYHQQQLKNSSFYYSTQSKAIHIAHYWFREFPRQEEVNGLITHVMVDLSMPGKGNNGFLFRSERRFTDWDQIVHPMYYDRGGGGYHHSVTGMGTKMYAAMTYQNRLLCNLGDKVFAPKLLFRPTSANNAEEFQMIRFGDYAELPAGYDTVQMPTQGFLDEGLEFNQVVSQVIASNLSQYRGELKKQDGNPITATEVNRQASEETTMSTADTNRAYEQFDWLYAEKFRRACNFNLSGHEPGAQAALKFQQRCVQRGVPKQALKMAVVTASRIAGSGNAFLRKQTLQRLLSLLARLPESGQEALIRDYVAAEAGFSLVNRYAPERDKSKLPSDEEAFATLQVVSAKDGIAPVVAEGQNPVVFAQVFLGAAAQALQGLQKAGPSAIPQALSFVETLGGAIGKHLDRIKNDPTRAALYKKLEGQFQQLGKQIDALHRVAKQMQQKAMEDAKKQRKAKQIASGGDADQQLKDAIAQRDAARKDLKVRTDLAHKNAKTRMALAAKEAQVKQNLAAKDLEVAATLRHKQAVAQSTIRQKKTAPKKA